jgi:hypothetical protein
MDINKEFQLAFYYYQKRDLQQARNAFIDIIKIHPNEQIASYFLGIVYAELEEYDLAIPYLQKSLEYNIDNACAYFYLGDAFWNKGQYKDASTAYQKSIELDKDNPIAHVHWSFSLFALGELSRGWKEYQWHWKTKEGINILQAFSQPIWTGFDISGRTILVRDAPKPFSGFGDTIQFIRYVPLIAKRGATIIFQSHKELMSLIKKIEGIQQVVEFEEEPPDFDVHCFLLDLPFVFNISLDNIPLTIPYIPVDPMLSQVWAEKIRDKGDTLKVGLVWSAEGGDRSCDLNTFSSLGSISDIIYYSLQKGSASEQAKNPPKGMQLIILDEEIRDFSVTAAVIANLDLVISVDTAVAHLAGALGKKVWTLLPYIAPWRWMLDREDSPWYPTMRLFRQPAPGDWNSAMAKVRDELLKLLNKTNGYQ